jgi:hypothetical protein
MAKRSSGGGAYYYAGGEKVELTRADDLVAVDERALANAGLPEAIGAAVHKVMRSLSAGVGLVDCAKLGGDVAEVVRALQAAKVTFPVFRSHGAVIVALPEVRVEETRGPKQKRLADWLASHTDDAVVKSRREDQLVLEPASGYGGDALALANRLTEQVGPEMAQVRFLRVTPRPSTMRG